MYGLLGSDTVSSRPGQESFVETSSFCCKACSIHSCHKELFQKFWISQQLLLNSILAAVHHAAVMSDLALISCKHSWRCHLDISGNDGIEESLLIICKRLLNECGSRIQGTLSINCEKAAPSLVVLAKLLLTIASVSESLRICSLTIRLLQEAHAHIRDHPFEFFRESFRKKGRNWSCWSEVLFKS